MASSNPTFEPLRASLGRHVCAAVLALMALPGYATTVSTFNSGAEGWTSVGAVQSGAYPVFQSAFVNSAVVYASTGGNPGGYITKQDPDENWQYFSAPAAFLGNQSSVVGSTLRFDELVLNTFGQSIVNPQGPLVAITSGSTTLVYGGSGSTPAVASSGWTTLTVPLVATQWRVGTPAGATATAAQFNTVMSGLSGLYILSDFWGGFGATGEIIGLDNVVLGPVPEPSTAVIMTTALAALSLSRRLRRRLRVPPAVSP